MNCPYAEDGSYCGFSGTGPCPCRRSQEKLKAVALAERKVLAITNARFAEYMADRHYQNEEAVLADLVSPTTATALIRAVAQWRITKRPARRRK